MVGENESQNEKMENETISFSIFNHLPIHNRNLRLILFIQMLQIMLCLCRDHAGEQQHSDQVRDGHECIQHVRNRPHKIERKHRCAHNDRDKQHLIRQNCLFAEQILSGTLAVVRPSEDGGVRERNDADHQNQRTDIRNLCECRRGHLTAV